MDFYKRIAQNAQRLNKSDNEILSYCVRNNQKISGMKVQEVAQELYTSPASMIRFCKKLGFSGFSEFKAALRLELSGRQDRGEKENESVDFLKDVHKTLQLVQEDTVDRILELIHKSRQVEIYAAGSSRMVPSEFVKRLQIIGKPAFCYDDSSLMNISARQVTGEDLVIIISASGETTPGSSRSAPVSRFLSPPERAETGLNTSSPRKLKAPRRSRAAWVVMPCLG